MGDHPPPALLVRPEDALAAVRSAILLGAVVPNVRGAADQLAADLTKLVALRTDQQRQTDQLRTDAGALAESRTRIALLLDDKRAARDRDESALTDEQRRAADLAGQESNLRDLVARLELAKAPVLPPAQIVTGSIPKGPLALGKPDRLAPAVAFADTRGLLPKPVNGRVTIAFGTPNALGVKAQGISFATRAGAEVVAPADGTVAFAGEFRSYGQLLIINVGGGYYVLLAGMERIDVQLGQFVLAGEPVAAMASQRLASAGATLVGTTEPVLYVEFRKDSASIDPTPWWVASN
jgi:septal ring factor EnvC (AmiA/AmiB activator)